MPSLIGDVNVLNIGNSNSFNKTRVEYNDFGDDSRSGGDWDRSRGHKSRGKGGKHGKGHGKY